MPYIFLFLQHPYAIARLKTNLLLSGTSWTAQNGTSLDRRQQKLFYFSKKDCLICPLQSQCPSFSEREGRARVFLSLDRQLRSTLSLSPETQKALYRFRTIVERIYGKAKHWHGFAKARYRGRWRVAIQSFLTFFVLNAKKAVRIKAGLCPIKPPGLATLGYSC